VQGTRLAKPVGWREGIPLVAGLLAFVAATNRWLGWDGGFALVQANDQRAYLTIANAFPDLPTVEIADQHAQRWPVHWSIGGLADLFGTTPEVMYSWVAALLAVAICMTLLAVLVRLRVSVAAAALALALFVLSPYAFRFYVFAPGYLSDLVFELALAVVLLGAVRRSVALVLAGLAVGVLARQTMLVVAPVVVAWIALAGDWRRPDGRRAWIAAGAAIVVPVVAYMVVQAGAADFAARGYGLTRLTIVDTVMDLPDTASDLGNHFAHVAIVLIVVTALLVATLAGFDPRRLPAQFWGPLAIGGVIVLQAIGLNPDPIAYDYSSTNEPRLTAMALPALGIALAVARGAVEALYEAARENTGLLALAGVPLLALASLHQKFTAIPTGSAAATLALQLLVGLAVFALVWFADRRALVSRPGHG
jgi:hypothetical protein